MIFLRFALIGALAWACSLKVKAEEPPMIVLREGKAVLSKDAPEHIKKVVEAANEIAGKPYKWGGGHAVLDDEGFDCSGAVSYVLRKAGLLDGALSSKGFLEFGKEGEGYWLTVWVRKGHVFLTVAGMRFDTQGQNEEDGPRWTSKERNKETFRSRKLP